MRSDFVHYFLIECNTHGYRKALKMLEYELIKLGIEKSGGNFRKCASTLNAEYQQLFKNSIWFGLKRGKFYGKWKYWISDTPKPSTPWSKLALNKDE